VNLNSILRTATFRLAALYVVVFALSVLVLGGIIYWIAQAALVRQFDRSIEIEAAALESEFHSGGFGQLQNALREREKSGAWRGFRYELSLPARDPAGQSSNPISREGLGWRTSEIESGRGTTSLTTLTIALDDSLRLTVGRSPVAIYVVENAILESFFWVLGAVLVIGIVGGLFLSSRFLDRIDGISAAAEAIIAGNYRERMPVSATDDDIDRLSRTLNVMLDHISELMVSLRQVANDIAHDLRTPLSRLRQRLEAATTMQLNEQGLRDAISSAIAETDDILATFSALLRIAQIDAGTRRAAFRQINLSDVVRDVAEAYAPSLQEEDRQLTCDIAPDLTLPGDRELVTQLVANLIENAARHTPGGTRVLVSLSQVARGLELVISDSGPGVPEEARERLFQRFYRLESSRSTPGSGLGLSLVKSICNLHGADIRLGDNDPGLRVTITFPWSGAATAERSSLVVRPAG
jgi:signal transduction histidine kinase